jgi:hypothetical protein
VVTAIGSFLPPVFRRRLAILGPYFLIAGIPLFTHGRSILPPLAQLRTSLAPMSIVTKATLLRLRFRNRSAVASCEVPAEVFL